MNTGEVRKAIEQLHSCKVFHIKDIAVIENFGDKTVWEGIVHVFKIAGNDKADTCFAWSSPIEGSTKTGIMLC